MNKEKFFDALGNHDSMTAFMYNNDEILAKFSLPIISVEDYDDEIVVRGDGTSFVVLLDEPEITYDQPEEPEYVFKNGNCIVGIMF